MWSQLECGYDSENETIVFGSRQIAEGDALYETHTVAVVRADDQTTQNPTVQCVNTNGKILLATDCIFRVLSNNCLDLDLYTSFECCINTFSISNDGKIIILCLNDGNVHCLHLPSGGKLLCSALITENLHGSTCSIFSAGDASFISFIICTNNSIYRLKINEIDGVYDQISNELEDLKIDFTFGKLDVNINQGLTCFTYENNIYYIFNKKCFADCNKIMLALDDEGTILAICKLTKMIFKLHNEDKFKNLMNLKSLNDEEHNILVNCTDDKNSYIRLLTFPNFDTVYNLKVSENTYLVSIDSEKDEVMFIEGFCTKGSQFVNELRLKVITESNPEVKLQRLLRRKCFEEAKKFAKTFKLDLEQVFTAEVEEYIIQNNFQISNVGEFCILLDNVKDIVFVVQQCLINTSSDTLENLEKLWKYAYSRLKIVLQNNPEDAIYNEYINTILESFFKLDTFKLLHYNVDFLNSENLIDAWTEFSRVDYLDEMHNYLKNGKINECTLLFNRLQQQYILNEDDISNILNNIPSHVSLLDSIPLIRHIILFSIQFKPEILPVVVKWIYDSVLKYNVYRSNWLEKLLAFCNHINNFLYSNEVQDLFFQKNLTQNGCLNGFRELLSVLNELSLLKHEFGIKLTVPVFMQNPDTVVYILLSEVSLKLLKVFINNYLFKFCSQRQMSVDSVLSCYVKLTSSNHKTYWEETVISLIPFISSNTLRIETILVVLESAEVPWNSTVEELAQQGSEECHPLASKVKTLKDNIPWKLLLKKYSIPDQPNYSNDDVILIARIILKISSTALLDDFSVLITKFPYLKDRLQLLCFDCFVQKGKMKSALKYIDGLKNEINSDCFNSALTITQDLLFTNLPFDIFINNYLEILPSLLRRIEKNISQTEYEICNQRLKRLKNIHILKSKYGCKEISDIDFDLSTLLPKLIEKKITPDTDWDLMINNFEELSYLLDITKEEYFFELEKHVANLESLNVSAENIIKIDSSAPNMCTMAVLLITNLNKNQISLNSSQQNGVSSLQSKSNKSSSDVTKALELINKLALKACMKADFQELQTACEILNWSNGCFWIKNMSEKDNFRISSLYCPEYLSSLSAASTLAIKSYFSLLLNISSDKINNCDLNNESMEKLLNQIDLLSNQMKQLHIEGYDLTVYHLLNVLKIELMSIDCKQEIMIEIIQKINNVLNARYVPQLLDKIFVSKKIDMQLALCLFFSSGFQVSKWIPSAIKKYKMNVKKLHAVSSLYYSFLELRGVSSDVYLNLKYRCEWWTKFLHNCISFSDTFQFSPSQIVCEHLLKSDRLNLQILKDFCKDFGLDIQKFLPLFLKSSLLQWKPKIEDGNISGADELFTKCKEMIISMENKRTVVEHLESSWTEISYYQHEVYLCILDLFVTLEENCMNPDKRILLMFLKDYRRIKKPQQKEIDDWQTQYPFAREIDPLSEYRLPFFTEMGTKDFWEIIRPEINLMTYEKWINNAPYLDLDRNHICIFAIKGTINSGVLNSKESNWSRNSRHNTLLSNMALCIQNITDLKQATAVLYQAVKKISGGADQVSIAEMCWKKALQWRNATQNESDVAISNTCAEVRRKYLDCLTMEILHNYNVGTEKYLNLIENTEQLIKELYQDESIIERTKGTVMFYPDINSAVDELGARLSKDLDAIRTSLIMEFLQKSCKVVSFDDTFCIPSLQKNISDEDNSDGICDNLKRVIYICESKSYETWCDLLSNISFAKFDETISKFASTPDLSMRVKALQCLIIITNDVDELQEMIGEPPNAYLEKLQILLSLESLGYSLTVHELNNCNKMDLASNIIRTKSSDPVIIRSLAKLCSIFNIWESSLWNTILQRFIDLKMLTDLKFWLPKLYNICYAPDLECPFVNGWASLIKNSFTKALTDKQNYAQGFLLIQICPIVSMLESNFTDLFNLYYENNIFDICAMFLPYIQSKQVKEKLIKALESQKNSELFERIQALSLQGIFNTDIVIRLLQNS